MCQVAFLFSSSTSYLKINFNITRIFQLSRDSWGGGGSNTHNRRCQCRAVQYHLISFFAFQVCIGWNKREQNERQIDLKQPK